MSNGCLDKMRAARKGGKDFLEVDEDARFEAVY